MPPKQQSRQNNKSKDTSNNDDNQESNNNKKNNNNNNTFVDPAIISSSSADTTVEKFPVKITTGQGALAWFKAQQQQNNNNNSSSNAPTETNNKQEQQNTNNKRHNNNNNKKTNNNASGSLLPAPKSKTGGENSLENQLAAGSNNNNNKSKPKSYAEIVGPSKKPQQQENNTHEQKTQENEQQDQQQEHHRGGRGGRGGAHHYQHHAGGRGGSGGRGGFGGITLPTPHSVQNTSQNVASSILNVPQTEEQKREMEEWSKYVELGRIQQMRVVDAIKQQEELTSTAAARIAQQQQRLDLDHILEVIEQHDVTFICTDTGSGKSTTVPNALLTRHPDAKIASSQPRRTATMSIASHVAKIRGSALGDEVGYWIRGEKRGDDNNTRLWYMTSYTLLLHLLGSPLNPPYTHIILDEFHERQPDIEVTVALARLCLKRGAKFKLIIMSATLNTDEWEEYFSKDLSVAFYKQSEPDHPIHNFFLEDICPMVGQPMLRTPPNQQAVDNILVDQSLLMAQHLIAFLNAVTRPEHAILVFLPGRANVDHFQHWIETSMHQRIEAIPWHGSVDLHVIEQAILKPATSRQKVYLATDIAEVSITLPDVVFVVDLALVKRPQIVEHDPASVLFPPLGMTYIGRSNVMQRRGRVGRTQQGFYFCMLPKNFVSTSLSQFLPPPIHNSRIDELALHCLQLASNPVAVFSLCRGQPSFESITASMRTLCDIGCILPKTNKASGVEDVHEIFENTAWSKAVLDDAQREVGAAEAGVKIDEYSITFIGRLLQLLPVNVQSGMLVFYGLMFGIESVMTLAAACASSQTPFAVNPHLVAHQQQQQHGGNAFRRPKASADSVGKAMAATEASMKSFGPGESSDVLCVMFAVIEFRRWWTRFTAHHDGLNPDDALAQQWCIDNHLSWEKLMAIIDLDQHIKYELSGFMSFHDVEDPEILSKQLQQFSGAVLFALSSSFASQALIVTNEGASQYSAKEGARGLFTDLKAMPDLHAPSCIRWAIDEVIVPVSVSLRFNHLLAGFSTKLVSLRSFYLSALLLNYKLNHASFEDDNGKYHEFCVEHLGTKRVVETDDNTATAILDFRARLSQMCAALRLRYTNKQLDMANFDKLVQAQLGFSFAAKQQDVLTLLTKYFLGAPAEKLTITEIEKGDEELDEISLLSFALPQKK